MRDDPLLDGKPVAVGGNAAGRGVIATANYEARQYGVHSAMASAYAKKLCPGLIIIRPDFNKYREASRQLHRIFRQYTADIEPLSLDEAFLDVTGKQPTLLRPGGVTREAIEAEIGPIHISNGTNVLRAPGMQPSHYAPRLPMRLEAVSARAGEALLAFGPDIPSNAARILNLSPAADLAEAAANLFAMLRALDRPRYSSIAVMPIPDHDLGLAINDRLRRAAVRLPTSTG